MTFKSDNGFLVCIIALTSAVLSSTAVAGGQWLQGRHPIFVRTNTSFIGFQTTEPIQNIAGCPNTGFYAVPTANDSKAALAVLLAANLAGKTVSIYVSDNSCDASSQRPLVTDVQMEQ